MAITDVGGIDYSEWAPEGWGRITGLLDRLHDETGGEDIAALEEAIRDYVRSVCNLLAGDMTSDLESLLKEWRGIED